ncbi:hypothetical protein HXX76_013409 [Chlamydomonas incerta]|uniref:phytol kinase n=1 Tax=Chlamydomonas incerta TaxID=51695 RepID=A0A835SF15_CHLIN|nr:hypothetical protein HXX76_013409 [Chlamydomonas incerta]|eukprot:KAG2425784.1 hypothetical protein HXX76_013409 [Chlamydomonas incerta]
MRAARARSSAASESAALRALRKIAACADELLTAPRISRLLPELDVDMFDDLEEAVNAAWQSAWCERRLRIRLCQALGTLARRLTQRVQAGVAGDDRELSTPFQCFLALNDGFCNLVSDQGAPVPADVRVELIKLMLDSDLLPALVHLAAATAEAEARETAQRVGVLRAVASTRPTGGSRHRHRAAASAMRGDQAATLRCVTTMGACTCMVEALTNAAVALGEDVDGLRAVGLHAALERSGALGWVARSVLRELAALGEAGAAEKEAAVVAAAAAHGASRAGTGRAGATAAAGPGSAGAAASASAGSTSAAGAGAGPPAASPAAMQYPDVVVGQAKQVAAIITDMWTVYEVFCKQAAVATVPDAATAAAASSTATAAAADTAVASRRRAIHTCWLERQLFDPGMQHFLLLHVLAQVTAADNGSSYGLEPWQQLPRLLDPWQHEEAHALSGRPPSQQAAGGSTGVGPSNEWLLADVTLAALEMWLLARPQPQPPAAIAVVATAAHTRRTAAPEGSSGAVAAPVAAAAAHAAGFISITAGGGGEAVQPMGGSAVGSGGMGGGLRRPPLPVRGFESLLLRLVDTCLAALAPGVAYCRRQQQLCRQHQSSGGGGGARQQALGAAAALAAKAAQAAADDTPPAWAPVLRPGACRFPPRGSLVAAAKALLLAVSNRQLQQAQQAQQQVPLQPRPPLASPAAAAKAELRSAAADDDGGGWTQRQRQGDVRALWRPLVRVAHACVDTAAAAGTDLGDCERVRDGTGAAVGPANPCYPEALAALPALERAMCPEGGLCILPLPAGRNRLFSLPPAPLPGQAAALSSGYLSALERLLRARHRTAAGAGLERCRGGRGLLSGGASFGLFAGAFRSFEPTWAAAFAYGRPGEVASLVATSAQILKLMASTVAWTPLPPPPPPGGLPDTGHGSCGSVSGSPAAEAELLALCRALLTGPNLLQGLLTWLAESAAAGDAAAGPAAAAGLAPAGGCWWQRRWSRVLGSGTESVSHGGGGGPSTAAVTDKAATATAAAASAAEYDWGLPRPALQALALSSLTLRRRWLQAQGRAVHLLCVRACAQLEAARAAAKDSSPGNSSTSSSSSSSSSSNLGGAVSSRTTPAETTKRTAPDRQQQELPQTGATSSSERRHQDHPPAAQVSAAQQASIRAALGAARLVFAAAAPALHAFTACRDATGEAAMAAVRVRATTGTGTGTADAGGSSAGRGGGVDAAAMAVAAEAASAAAAWTLPLLEALPPCLVSCTQLLVNAAETEVEPHAALLPDVRRAARALLLLTARMPLAAAERLQDCKVAFHSVHVTPAAAPAVPVAGVLLAPLAAALQVLLVRQSGPLWSALEVAGDVLRRGGTMGPGEPEALLVVFCDRDRGGGGGGGCVGGGGGSGGECASWEEDYDDSGADSCARRVAALLPPPPLAAELLGLPPSALEGCSNGACVRLPGDSAAGAPSLQRCGGRCGGAVAYCCKACQVEHWRAGHKEECGPRQ